MEPNINKQIIIDGTRNAVSRSERGLLSITIYVITINNDIPKRTSIAWVLKNAHVYRELIIAYTERIIKI